MDDTWDNLNYTWDDPELAWNGISAQGSLGVGTTILRMKENATPLRMKKDNADTTK